MTLVLGATIGNYRVISQLGEGGMGIVYLAEHPALGRKAAVKVLHPDMAKDPSVVSRFFNEARATTAIKHPNIVQTLDFGSLPDGSSYIVMEYLEGESLAARIKRLGRLPVAEALEIAAQAASALAAAHDKEIVHRDLKPDNVFLCPDTRATSGQGEQVKILDFGIAKLSGKLNEHASHKTRTGSLIGTPLYMSPEQCLAERDVDGRSDIYSLAVILYEMLCGAPPFQSEGFGALINMHINAPPPPLRARNPLVPEHIEAVVMRALAKSPADRFPGMREFRDALGLTPPRSDVGAAKTLALAGGVPTPRPAPVPFSGAPLSTPSPARATAATDPIEEVGPQATAPTKPHLKDPRRTRPRWIFVLLGIATAALAATVLTENDAPESIAARTTAAPRLGRPMPPPETPTIAAPPVAPPPRLWIHTDPPGVEVRLDGRLLGTSPIENQVVARAANAILTLSGAGLVAKTVNLPIDIDQRLSYVMQKSRPAASRPAAATPRPTPRAFGDLKTQR